MRKKRCILTLFTVAFMLIHSLALASSAQAASTLKDELTELIYLYKNQSYIECIAYADRLLEENPALIGAHTYKALSFFKQKNYPEAEKTYKEILKYNFLNPEALYNLACVYALQNKEAEAAMCLEKLMALEVTNKRGIKVDNDFYNIRENIIYKNIIGISVRVGGKVLFFDVLPQLKDGRTLVPMRLIFETLGADVTWVEEVSTVLATKGNKAISLTVGSDLIYINGNKTQMDTMPVLESGRVLVPLRFVAEALDAEVFWNGRDEIVDIITKAPEGNKKYSEVKEQLNELTEIVIAEGGNVQPYNLAYGQVKTMIVAQTKEALDSVNSMSSEEREKYFSEFANPEFVYESRVYYKIREGELTYFEKGILSNVVVLDKEGYNYKDYY